MVHDDEKERMGRSGWSGAADGTDRRDLHGRLLAQQPDTDTRPVPHCPRQSIGVGAAAYPCERDGDGHCWRCDRYGLPVVANPAIPGSVADLPDFFDLYPPTFRDIDYVYAVDLAKPDSGVTIRIDSDGTFHTISDRDKGGGES
jgi:hypothetical protein